LLLTQDEPASNLTDCVLKHKTIAEEYDAFHSYTHPRRSLSSPHCRGRGRRSSVSSSSSSTLSGTSGSLSLSERCRRRWYLGVNRRGRVRVVKTARRPPPTKTFFYKVWFHRRRPQPTVFPTGPWIPNLFSSTTTPSPSTAERTSRNGGSRRWRSRPAFPLLSYGRRRNGSRRHRRPSSVELQATPETSHIDEDVSGTGTRCGSNLLSNCVGRRRNSSHREGSTRSRKSGRGRRRGSSLMRAV